MISVIVPNFNSEKYLSKCLDSLIRQTYKEIEIIVVDDGSTDKSVDLVRNIQERDGRILLYCIEHSGPGVARNYGIRKSKGKYIFFCDSDDTVPPEGLKYLFNEAEEGNADISIGDYRIIHNDKSEEVFKTPPLKESRFNTFFESVTVWNRIYRRSFLINQELYFPSVEQGEDRLFLAKAYLKDPKISTLNKIVYIWQRHESDKDRTLSQRRNLDCLLGQISCMKEFMRIMKKRNSEELMEHIKYNCGYLLKIYLSIEDKDDGHKGFKVLNEYINSLEWKEDDKIFKEIFLKNHTKFCIEEDCEN